MATKTRKPEETQNARLSFRLRAEHKDLIEQAALTVGQSVSAFAVSTLVTEAERLVERSKNIKLSKRDSEMLLEMLDNPPEPGDRLRRAFARHKAQVKHTGP